MRRARLFAPLAVAAAVGCSTAVTPLTPPTKSVAVGPVELTEVSVAGLEQAVKEQRGKVVLLDVWFLGCSPCVKKFPHIVELHRKYAEDGLVVMSVDTFEEELNQKDKVTEFLRKQGADFPNFILKDDPKPVTGWLDRYDAGITPAVVLFGRNGEQVPLSSRATLEQVEVAVRTELAKK